MLAGVDSSHELQTDVLPQVRQPEGVSPHQREPARQPNQEPAHRVRAGLQMTTTRRLIIGSALVWSLAAFASPAEAGERTKSMGLWCSAKAADLATTELALSRGGFESNPLMKDRGVRIGAGVASCVVAGEADYRLRRHKKSRWALRIIGIGLMSYAAIHNSQVGK